jgi:D-glycero-D-manno-heptose 1,7-bisphosphate phosphatase
MKRFVILDRDGTIIEEKNYLSDPSQVVLLPNASQGLKQMLSLGLGLVIATNQSGIGRGYFDRATADRVHMRMLELLLLEGVQLDIDAIFVCPHVPDENCECRKPKTKLVQDAATKFGFLPAQSFMIGDKPCDIDLGKAVGATTFLVKTGYGASYAKKPDVQASYVVDDLKSAADVLKGIVSLI